MIKGAMMKKLLIVEDDQAIREALRYYFKKQDYIVTLSEGVLKAKQLILKENFDLVILDIGLADGDGYELAKYIRGYSQLPIIFLTARDEREDLYRAFELGGDDYLTKPFEIKELDLRIQSILRRMDVKNEKRLRQSGDISIDSKAVRVFKREEQITLTATEYKLLTLFFDNPKQAITRDDILKYIWQTNEDIDGSNTISVYVKRLREKIEDDPSFPNYIKTVRGVGYMWNEDVD